MKRIGSLVVATVMALAWAAPAGAYYLTLSGGTPGAIPGGATNDFISAGLFGGPTIGGYYGTQLLVHASGGLVPDGLKVEFFGAEAGFHNAFNLGGSELFAHPGGRVIAPALGAPLATYTTSTVGTGSLPFSFNVNGGAAIVLNGDDASGPNFFASCVGASGRYCDAVYLFLDDGGAGPDSDYDDFLVRITVTGAVPVPEPGTLTLLALAVLVVSVVLRRNRKQSPRR